MKEDETAGQVKPLFTLTDKEELAVIVERIRTHRDKTTNEKAKVRLDLASDLIRNAIIWITS